MEIVKNFTQSKILKNLFVVLVGTVLLAISSKIKIPFYPVPMTMQTFIVLVIGIGFGWKIGIATVALYLFEGLIGLPVFSGTPEKGVGFIYFTGPTMGYLIGFLGTIFFAGRYLSYSCRRPEWTLLECRDLDHRMPPVERAFGGGSDLSGTTVQIGR